MQEYFSEIQAPRHQGYIKHKLEDILVIIMCAVLCGLDELCTIMEFAQSKKDFLKKHFNIEAIPSKPTMSRILTLARSEFEIASTSEINSGRIEKRVCRKLRDITWLQQKHNWEGLKSVFSVERTITDSKSTTRQTNYYISSCDIPPDKLLEISREHRKIESLHWLLDVVFNEDGYKLSSENAHITLNAFRKFALMKHKNFLEGKKKKPSLKGNMFRSLLSDSFLIKIIAI